VAHRLLLTDVKKERPVKTFTTIRLGFYFSVFLGLALATQGQAEEHYIYQNPHGKLVISNQPPPPGSNVLRKLDLPEPADPQAQQPREGNDAQLNGRSEGSAKPSKTK
jgi:hypothetical protein